MHFHNFCWTKFRTQVLLRFASAVSTCWAAHRPWWLLISMVFATALFVACNYVELL